MRPNNPECASDIFHGTQYFFFIVAASNRPQALRSCLASIQCQTEKDWFCLIMDEGYNGEIVDQFRDERFKRIELFKRWVMDRGTLGLWPKEKGASLVPEDSYVIFPNEDTHYLPGFLMMVKAAVKECHPDIVVCDFIHELNGYAQVIEGAPVIGRVDSSTFAMRRNVFDTNSFSNQYEDAEMIGIADGLCVVNAVKAGATCARIAAALVVHT